MDVQGVGLRGRRADEHVLPAAGDRRASDACTPILSCARMRICCTASPARPSARLFRQLLKISGVGARTALAVLSGMTVEELYHAVANADSARLIKIPGIGKKPPSGCCSSCATSSRRFLRALLQGPRTPTAAMR